MPESVKIIRPGDSDFVEMMQKGDVVSGADLNTAYQKWSGEKPDEGDEPEEGSEED